MSVKYKVISRQNPANRSESKYYAMPAPCGEVSFNEFINRMGSNHHILKKMDVYYLIKCMAEEAGNVLSEGKILRLDDLGSFHVSFTSEGKNSHEEVRSSAIESLKIRYAASAYLKKVLKTVHFEKAK